MSTDVIVVDRWERVGGLAAYGAALALVRPWGLRIPARLLVAGSWIGAGFLVPLLPYALVGLFDIEGGELPAWEAVLIQAGVVGMGLGLAVAWSPAVPPRGRGGSR
jgi:hypothetical protein